MGMEHGRINGGVAEWLNAQHRQVTRVSFVELTSKCPGEGVVYELTWHSISFFLRNQATTTIAGKLAVGDTLFLSVQYHMGAAVNSNDLCFYGFWYFILSIPVWYSVVVVLQRAAEEVGRALMPILLPLLILGFVLGSLLDLDSGSGSRYSDDPVSDVEDWVLEIGAILLIIGICVS